jgi:hypothetical protein
MNQTEKEVVEWLRGAATDYGQQAKDAKDGVVAGCFTYARIVLSGAADAIETGSYKQEGRDE